MKINLQCMRNKYFIFYFLLLIISVNICEPVKNIYMFFYFGTICIIIKWIIEKKYLTRNHFVFCFFWLVMFFLPRITSSNFLSFNNGILKYEGYIILGVVLSMIRLPYVKMIKLIAYIGYLHVLATYIFLFLPQARYQAYAIRLYGKFPIGTDNGAKGYTAALCSHYSANALYIGIVVIAIAILILTNNIKKKQGIFLFLGAFGALLLTEKRAHLLFVTFSLFVVYFIMNKHHLNKLLNRLLIGIIVIIPLIIFGICSSSRIMNVFGRFSGLFSGKDITTGRMELWHSAIDLFFQHPISGIGWQKYMSVANAYFNVHNTYLQVFCETGFFGGLTYIGGLVSGYFSVRNIVVKKTNEEMNKDLRCGLFFSVCMQVFFILYGFTGNVLYDNTLFFYMISLGIGMSAVNQQKCMLRKSDNKREKRCC